MEKAPGTYMSFESIPANEKMETEEVVLLTFDTMTKQNFRTNCLF